MAPLPEELARPLAVIDRLFAGRIAEGAGGTAPSEWGEHEHFVQALGLQNEDNFARIPCLNDVKIAESVPPFSLVRYRGMVQDTFEPEIYAALVEECDPPESTSGSRRVVTSKYRDCLEAAPGKILSDMGREGFGQRGAAYCVPLPGESAWSREAAREWVQANGGACEASIPLRERTGGSKRSRPDEDVDMAPEETAACPKQSRAVEPQPPPPPCPEAGRDALRTADEFGLNFPLPWEEKRGAGQSTACIVKLYDSHVEALRVCQAVDIVGVLCVNPEAADFDSGALADSPFRDARQVSTALVPRLHALLVRQLPFYHPALPYSPDFLTEGRLAAAYQRRFAAPGALEASRAAAITQLAAHLGGDAVAAEYVLMQLVARSFANHGGVTLGNWSMNLLRWPQGAPVQPLVDAVGEIASRAVRLEVTCEALNSRRWVPKKDYVANRIVAGQLQLAAGTLVVFDETALDEGQVNVAGTKAIAAIGNLMTQGCLTCDFNYDVSLPLEVSCISVSQRKSIVKDVSVAVPLRPSSPMPSAAAAAATGSLDAVRFLVGLVTRSPKSLIIPEGVGEQFANDFSAVRQELKTVKDLEHQRLRRCQEENLIGA